MTSDIPYGINSNDVISEIIDGEAVIINLDNGFYYSMDSTAAMVWSEIEKVKTAAEIINTFNHHFDVDRDTIKTDIRMLIQELLTEELIVPVNDSPNKNNLTRIESDSKNISGLLEYTRPVLNKYTDLEDLLLLDPVHDVDDAGWPNKPLKSE